MSSDKIIEIRLVDKKGKPKTYILGLAEYVKGSKNKLFMKNLQDHLKSKISNKTIDKEIACYVEGDHIDKIKTYLLANIQITENLIKITGNVSNINTKSTQNTNNNNSNDNSNDNSNGSKDNGDNGDNGNNGDNDDKDSKDNKSDDSDDSNDSEQRSEEQGADQRVLDQVNRKIKLNSMKVKNKNRTFIVNLQYFVNKDEMEKICVNIKKKLGSSYTINEEGDCGFSGNYTEDNSKKDIIKKEILKTVEIPTRVFEF